MNSYDEVRAYIAERWRDESDATMARAECIEALQLSARRIGAIRQRMGLIRSKGSLNALRPKRIARNVALKNFIGQRMYEMSDREMASVWGSDIPIRIIAYHRRVLGMKRRDGRAWRSVL